MAYITAEETKVIRNNIKKAFPAKQGWKISVRCEDHSSVAVAIMQCPADYAFKGYQQLNHFYLDSSAEQNGYSEKEAEMLKKLKDIVAANHWDESDSQTDYFNCAYYYHIHVGQWNKDCVQKAA